MSNIKEIEKAVERLSAEELTSFRSWFAAYDAAQWDADIERDIASGKLDSLADEALSEFRAGSAREFATAPWVFRKAMPLFGSG